MNTTTSAALPWLAEPLLRGKALRAHALLLHGPAGVGQFELGIALAEAWLCEATTSVKPCRQCIGCRMMQSHSHSDFHLLLPEALREPLGWLQLNEDGEPAGKASKTKPSKEIRVEAVRAAIDWTQRSSARGGAKVLLIHPAEAMNAVTANALLKTLEEPPGRLRLLLTAADPEGLLPTVRSRCQRLALPKPAPELALAWLTQRGVARAEVLLVAADGQPLTALSLAEEGIDADQWERLPVQVQHGQAAAFAHWSVPRMVDALQRLAHDLMAVAAGGAPRYFARSALPSRLPSLDVLGAWARDLIHAARHDEHPWSAALRIEALVGRAAALWRANPDGATVQALDTLRSR